MGLLVHRPGDGHLRVLKQNLTIEVLDDVELVGFSFFHRYGV